MLEAAADNPGTPVIITPDARGPVFSNQQSAFSASLLSMRFVMQYVTSEHLLRLGCLLATYCCIQQDQLVKVQAANCLHRWLDY
jgi:hypothetical protein